ncbi:MAG: enoyl-CoA hydratase [Rhodospirillaceae bacterium]|nr:enoyl-CoA hydratase [Rhodospirillaceae bacterium]|tara:strand:+ start:67796 stop:68512 length:717 start_codon:yes stop_codon:yes gene_type:complete
MSDVLLKKRNGAIERLTLNRPEKRNALNSELVTELNKALEAAEADEEARVILLAANGSVFCAGADFKEFADQPDDTSAASSSRSAGMGRLFQMSPVKTKPVIAVVDGPALGGGAALAIACDIVIASDKAQFGYPEIKRGFTVAGVLPYLVRHVGLKAAFDLCATGRTIDVGEARDLGLVSNVVKSKDLYLEAETVAAQLAGYSADALSVMKNIIYQANDLPLDEAIAFARTVKGSGKE